MTERAREAEKERARERGRERGVSRDEMDVWGRRGRVTGGGSGSCTTILVAVAAGPAQRCACRHRYCTSGRVWFAHCNTVYMTLTVWVFTITHTNTTRPLSRDVSRDVTFRMWVHTRMRRLGYKKDGEINLFRSSAHFLHLVEDTLPILLVKCRTHTSYGLSKT